MKNQSYTELFKIAHVINKIPITKLLENISMGEFMAIGALKKFEQTNNGKNITVAVLADSLHVSVPAISRMLKNLEEKNLVKRVTDKACRRNTYVIITKDGISLHNQNAKILHSYIEKVLSHFDDEEIQNILTIHKKLLVYMTDELNTITN